MFDIMFSHLIIQTPRQKGKNDEEITLDVIPGTLHLLGRNDDKTLGG